MFSINTLLSNTTRINIWRLALFSIHFRSVSTLIMWCLTTVARIIVLIQYNKLYMGASLQPGQMITTLCTFSYKIMFFSTSRFSQSSCYAHRFIERWLQSCQKLSLFHFRDSYFVVRKPGTYFQEPLNSFTGLVSQQSMNKIYLFCNYFF